MMKKTINVILIVLTIILSLTVVGLFVKDIFYMDIIVIGSSMNNTLNNGDTGYALKSKFVHEYKRGDIIIFNENKNIDDKSQVEKIIKRVIGLPNEHLVITSNNEIFINESKLDETSYLNEDSIENTYPLSNHNFIDVTLGPNQYYVLGDNRANSNDSRFIGAVNKENIQGKLNLIYAHYDYVDNINNIYKNKKYITWKWF